MSFDWLKAPNPDAWKVGDRVRFTRAPQSINPHADQTWVIVWITGDDITLHHQCRYYAMSLDDFKKSEPAKVTSDSPYV